MEESRKMAVFVCVLLEIGATFGRATHQHWRATHWEFFPELRQQTFNSSANSIKPQIGVFPVFVVDGDPPALKSPARMVRFSRMTGIAFLSSEKAECINLERNSVFNRSFEECVEMLELMGIPVLRAKGEAEAICAQINREGHGCSFGHALYLVAGLLDALRPHIFDMYNSSPLQHDSMYSGSMEIEPCTFEEPRKDVYENTTFCRGSLLVIIDIYFEFVNNLDAVNLTQYLKVVLRLIDFLCHCVAASKHCELHRANISEIYGSHYLHGAGICDNVIHVSGDGR